MNCMKMSDSTENISIKVVKERKNARGDFGRAARLEVAFARNEVVLARLEVGIGQAVTLVFFTGWAQTVDNFRGK